MYELEIETKNNLKKIRNPKKARIIDKIFFDILQVMDGEGKWHTVCHCCVGLATAQIIVNNINIAIKKHKSSVYVDI